MGSPVGYSSLNNIQISVDKSSVLTPHCQRKKAAETIKAVLKFLMPTAPGVPERSSIQTLSWPNAA